MNQIFPSYQYGTAEVEGEISSSLRGAAAFLLQSIKALWACRPRPPSTSVQVLP